MVKYLIENIIDNIKIDIPEDIKQIHNLFKQNRKKLYLVGGSVRDAILGQTPKDYDLATDATPDEVLEIAKNAGLHTTEVGKSFGVVIVNGHEIATFREDIGNSRKETTVKFTNIEGDVKRRDLTINSLFYDLDRNKVVDLVGGVDDLRTGTIRTVGNPDDRFYEDKLRKLRALRFYGQLGKKLDTETYNSLKKDHNLQGVSKERIRDEFIKSLIKSKNVKQYLSMAEDLGFLKQILEDIDYDINQVINSKNYNLILASLITTNDAQYLTKRLNELKYSREEVFNIIFLIELKNFEEENVYKYKIQQRNVTLSDEEILDFLNKIGSKEQKFVKFKLSERGDEAKKMGLKGKEVGEYVKQKELENYKKLK